MTRPTSMPRWMLAASIRLTSTVCCDDRHAPISADMRIIRILRIEVIGFVDISDVTTLSGLDAGHGMQETADGITVGKVDVVGAAKAADNLDLADVSGGVVVVDRRRPATDDLGGGVKPVAVDITLKEDKGGPVAEDVGAEDAESPVSLLLGEAKPVVVGLVLDVKRIMIAYGSRDWFYHGS